MVRLFYVPIFTIHSSKYWFNSSQQILSFVHYVCIHSIQPWFIFSMSTKKSKVIKDDPSVIDEMLSQAPKSECSYETYYIYSYQVCVS